MVKRINILLSRDTGIGTLQCVGGASYNCGGMVNFPYPEDSTINVSDKKGTVYSQEFNGAEMPYSILWIGQRGVYIHQWPNLELSHGCIHLVGQDAISVYNWVNDKTRIVFNWVD
jgi:lipoprotein-anchoring transpeptidase ErfK/SrfK